MKNSNLIIPDCLSPSDEVKERANKFLGHYKTHESENGLPLVLLFDGRSDAYYVVCHLNASSLTSASDIDAVLDPAETEDYKLNRDMYVNDDAYQLMKVDALNGRSFEDIVVEYDTSYRSTKPLKVFGGQHRIMAITEALRRDMCKIHGIRVYFDLSVDQRINIALVNNTSIAVSNDLLDRMQEEWLGADLRNWCQRVGLLADGQNFADRRSPDGIPTVRVARTLIVNFFLGKDARRQNKVDIPFICTSGGKVDQQYERIRSKSIDWDDLTLQTMGQEFVKLHKLQRKQILDHLKNKHIEFANKAIHPCVTASWAYAAGYFQNFPELKVHYALADGVSANSDPLNADALLHARLKGKDPDTYRGLGARMGSDELGRMLEVFLLQAGEAKKRGINAKLAEAAIQTYEAKKATIKANKAKQRI